MELNWCIIAPWEKGLCIDVKEIKVEKSPAARLQADFNDLPLAGATRSA